ncbi:hypothetical protein JW766_00130 [Candidatus Dojkabacteria bacterium]|nr:hypothetical protein [Candidatus Dojkabacteria bacterium]
MKNKKPIIFLIVGAIILLFLAFFCCCSVIWFISQLDNAGSSYKKSIENLSTADYYEYELTRRFTTSFVVPQYPGNDTTYDITSLMIVKEDNKNDRMHSQIYLETEEKKSKADYEIFRDGDKYYYLNESMSDFKEAKKEEGEDWGFEPYKMFFNLRADQEVETLEDENIDGVECYHLKIELTKDDVQELIDSLEGDILNNVIALAGEEEAIEGAYAEVWVDKENKTIMRYALSIDRITVGLSLSTSTAQGIEGTCYFEDVKIEVLFSAWAEEKEVESPL